MVEPYQLIFGKNTTFWDNSFLAPMRGPAEEELIKNIKSKHELRCISSLRAQSVKCIAANPTLKGCLSNGRHLKLAFISY